MEETLSMPAVFTGKGFRERYYSDQEVDPGEVDPDMHNFFGDPPVASSVSPVAPSPVAPVAPPPLAQPPELNPLSQLLASTARSRSTDRSTDMRPAPPIKKKVSKKEGIQCQICSKPGSPRFKKAARSKCRDPCSEVIVEGTNITCQWCKKVKKNTGEICCVGRPPKGNSQEV